MLSICVVDSHGRSRRLDVMTTITVDNMVTQTDPVPDKIPGDRVAVEYLDQVCSA